MIKQFIKYYLRNGRLFERYLKELKATERYSRVELQQYQNEKLRRTIFSAYEGVPYYRKIFDERHLKPSDIKTTEDLHKLPIIDKRTVQSNFSDFKNKNFKGLVFKGHTSGTTGTPGTFLRDLCSINFENAAITWHQSWANVKKEDKRVWLRGDIVVPNDAASPPFWKTNRLENQLVMSSYHLSDQFLPSYINQIREYTPVLLQAYPSTAYVLAKHLAKTNDFLKIPVVQTGSEPLHSHWRDLIKERFQAEIFDHYGTAERVGIGFECASHEALHMIPGYGITEFEDILTGDINLIEGKIIGTTLNNFLMPLIRYRTDDYSKTINAECACGRKYKRIRPIESKFEDMIVTPDGKRISPSVVTFCFKHAKNIKMSQIVQKEDGHINLKLVRAEQFRNQDSDFLVKEMQKILSPSMNIDVEFVNDIPRTKNGKFRWIISEINHNLT